MNRTVTALLVAVAAALTGCAGATAPPPAATPPAATPSAATPSAASSSAASSSAPSPTTETAAAPAPVEVEARLVDGRVDPFPRRVDVTLGTPVVLRIETDTPSEIHVHGYDHSADANPSAPAHIEFVADMPGVFEVEAHPGILLFQLVVQ